MAIDGLDALLQKLDSLQGNGTNALKVGIGRACKRIQAAAKQNCPVDTGRLRASIVTDVQGDSGTVTGTVATAVEYATYVEFGTGQRGNDSVAHRQDWQGQPPQPFLFPAYRENMEEVKNDIKNTVAQEIIKRGG